MEIRDILPSRWARVYCFVCLLIIAYSGGFAWGLTYFNLTR